MISPTGFRVALLDSRLLITSYELGFGLLAPHNKSNWALGCCISSRGRSNLLPYWILSQQAESNWARAAALLIIGGAGLWTAGFFHNRALGCISRNRAPGALLIGGAGLSIVRHMCIPKTCFLACHLKLRVADVGNSLLRGMSSSLISSAACA